MSTKTADPFGSAEAQQDYPDFSHYLGHVIILQRAGDPREVDTQFGTTEATPARLLDVDNDADGWVDLLIFPKKVQGTLRANAGKPVPAVLGREKTAAKKGQSPAYLLETPSAEQVKACRAAWEKHKDSMPF